MANNTKREDFKNLLNKMSLQKEKDIPIQKVVPAKEVEIKEKHHNTIDKFKISLSLYVEDWMDLTRFRNFKVLQLKKLDYTISDAILYGLSLLEEMYGVERNREKITLKRGRRSNEKSVRTSSIDLPAERVDFINDFLYHKVFVQKQIDYTRPEMFSELVELIKEKNKEIFKTKN